ncbi:MAG: Lrp/AsnC family transcriptional regulator, partial [Candidatus Lokiarchaeota archaeon]|nr:Lrp/AsnC family transcriptional regulator [Candidatus Lokiarchaeota archaeon]
MDIVDIKILELLKENSRTSFNDISQVVGKTEATVRRRVKKLTEDGIIKRFTIDYSIDNKPRTRATVKADLDFKEIKRIIKELLEIEEITNIWRLSGDCGLFIKVEIGS